MNYHKAHQTQDHTPCAGFEPKKDSLPNVMRYQGVLIVEWAHCKKGAPEPDVFKGHHKTRRSIVTEGSEFNYDPTMMHTLILPHQCSSLGLMGIMLWIPHMNLNEEWRIVILQP